MDQGRRPFRGVRPVPGERQCQCVVSGGRRSRRLNASVVIAMFRVRQGRSVRDV